MSKYRIFVTEQFSADLEEFSDKTRIALEKKIMTYVYPQIGESPHCGLNIKKLRNYSPETWRYRIGKYRIFYEIDETEMIIYILSITLRKDAY